MFVIAGDLKTKFPRIKEIKILSVVVLISTYDLKLVENVTLKNQNGSIYGDFFGDRIKFSEIWF